MRAHSSVGQSCRLITGWSQVRVLVGPSSFGENRTGLIAGRRTTRSVGMGAFGIVEEPA